MLTDKQKQERLNYLTGSDASIICGLSPYKDISTLWLEKTKKIVPQELNSSILDFGSYMEDGVANWFSAVTKKELQAKKDPNLPIDVHPQYSWMGANCDRLLKNENALLECKTAGKPGEKWGDGENTIPLEYLLQVAHYAMVYNVDCVYIAVVFSLTREMRYYTYERNKNLEESLLSKEHDFWFNHVLADIPPKPQNMSDVINLYTNITKDNPITASDEITDKIYQLQNIKAQLKELETKEKELKDQIGIYMGEHDTLIDPFGDKIATWKESKPVARFDTTTFKKAQPELYNQYVKLGKPNRTFRLNQGK